MSLTFRLIEINRERFEFYPLIFSLIFRKLCIFFYNQSFSTLSHIFDMNESIIFTFVRDHLLTKHRISLIPTDNEFLKLLNNSHGWLRRSWLTANDGVSCARFSSQKVFNIHPAIFVQYLYVVTALTRDYIATIRNSRIKNSRTITSLTVLYNHIGRYLFFS